MATLGNPIVHQNSFEEGVDSIWVRDGGLGFFTENTIESGNESGFRVDSSGNPRVSNNYFVCKTATARTALTLGEQALGTFEENHFQNHAIGVEVIAAGQAVIQYNHITYVDTASGLHGGLRGLGLCGDPWDCPWLPRRLERSDVRLGHVMLSVHSSIS